MIIKLQKETNLDNPKEVEKAEQMLSIILNHSLKIHEKKVLVVDSEENLAHRRVAENLNRDRIVEENDITKMTFAIEDAIKINVDSENRKKF